MGFAQATVSRPDGSREVHGFFSTMGDGLYDSQVACFSLNPCHNAPWWDLRNVAHGHETQVDIYDINGTLLSQTMRQYQAVCPPSGVTGTPTGRWGNFLGNLVSGMDRNNPVAVCDLQPTQVDQVILDGSSDPAAPRATTSYRFDHPAPVAGPFVLTAYMTSTNDTLLTTARQLSATAPVGESGSATTVGTGTGWGEIYSKGFAGAWGSGPPTPSGNGWILNATTLEGQTVTPGTWLVNGIKISLGTAGTTTADIHVRAYKRSPAGDYYWIGDFVSPAATITSAPGTYSFSGTGKPTSFAAGDKLYLEVVLNISANSAPAGAALTIYMNNGAAGQNVALPGYQSGPVSDPYGRLTTTTSTSIVGGATGSPTTIVHFQNYVWNDAVTATATGATGTYVVNRVAFVDTEDPAVNTLGCTYSYYEGQP